MDVFQVHQQLLTDYEAFTADFTKIHDPRIREHVDRRMANGDQWPDAYLSLNPNFASGGSISELVKQGLLHPECERIFRVGKEEPPAAPGQVIDLHHHQRETVEIARGGASYVLTTGTGSGKSLSYIVPIVDSVLQRATGSYQPGVKAIIVYPMNAHTTIVLVAPRSQHSHPATCEVPTPIDLQGTPNFGVRSRPYAYALP